MEKRIGFEGNLPSQKESSTPQSPGKGMIPKMEAFGGSGGSGLTKEQIRQALQMELKIVNAEYKRLSQEANLFRRDPLDSKDKTLQELDALWVRSQQLSYLLNNM